MEKLSLGNSAPDLKLQGNYLVSQKKYEEAPLLG